MKALVKSRAKRGLWLEDIPERTIGINDVLVRVLYMGICGTAWSLTAVIG
jgi:threonine 3-dehydrogenase